MFEEEMEQLGTFYRMPGNWDHRGANTIGFDAILRTMELMTTVFCEFGRKPYFICPTQTGGISIEYQYAGAKIEIEISDTVNRYAYLIDLGDNADEDNRYFIETDIEIENLIYRIGQIVGPLEEDAEEKLRQMELDRVEELQSKEDPIHPEHIWLTGKDYDRFVEYLENPPEPNPALLKALKEYQQWIESGKLITDAEEDALFIDVDN